MTNQAFPITPPPEPLRPIPVSESFQSLGQYLTELIMASETTSPAKPVTSDEISALSWNLEKAGIVLSIVDIARAALEKWERLATPPPKPPTDEELNALEEKLWDEYKTISHQRDEFMYDDGFRYALSDYRAALEKWGKQ